MRQAGLRDSKPYYNAKFKIRLNSLPGRPPTKTSANDCQDQTGVLANNSTLSCLKLALRLE